MEYIIYLRRNLLVGTGSVARPKLYKLASNLKTNGKDVYINKSWGKDEQGLVDLGDVVYTYIFMSPPGRWPWSPGTSGPWSCMLEAMMQEKMGIMKMGKYVLDNGRTWVMMNVDSKASCRWCTSYLIVWKASGVGRKWKVKQCEDRAEEEEEY